MGRTDWLLEDRLGEGATGEVWLARHLASDELRVFKFCFEADRVRALQREVALFRLLRDELGERSDITKILDWSFDDVPYVIESEYTAGGNLVDWCGRQGGASQVPLRMRLELVAQAADALAAAHSVGVLHKDVKPANLLVSEDETGQPKIKLTDFGIGLLTDRDRMQRTGFTTFGHTELAADGRRSSYEGTRLYMAPELMEGKAASVQADMYSLGILLYQMVVGDLTRALGPGWEREVEDDLLREDIAAAVDRDPGERLRDAQELADRLRRLDARRQEHQVAWQAERSSVRLRRSLRWGVGALVVLALVAAVALVQARRIAREAERANREAQTAKRVSDVMVEMFRMSDPSQARGNTVTAREILDRGVERIQENLTTEPAVQATLLTTMGRVYVGLGLYDVAAPLLEEALATRRGLSDNDSPEVAEALHDLANARATQSRFDEAERLQRESLAIRLALYGPENLDVAKSQHDLGVVLARVEQVDRAVPLLRQALATRRRLLDDDDPDVIESLNTLAQTLCWVQPPDLVGAEQAASEALDAARRRYGQHHPAIWTALTSLAVTYANRQEWAAAETTLRESIEEGLALYDAGYPELLLAKMNLGHILYERGKLAEATALFTQVLPLLRERLPPQHDYIVMTLFHIARVYVHTGKPELALSTTAEALSAMSEAARAGRLGIVTKAVRGQALVEMERYADAEGLLLAAHQRLWGEQGVNEPFIHENRTALVRLYERSGRVEEARRYRDLSDGHLADG